MVFHKINITYFMQKVLGSICVHFVQRHPNFRLPENHALKHQTEYRYFIYLHRLLTYPSDEDDN